MTKMTRPPTKRTKTPLNMALLYLVTALALVLGVLLVNKFAHSADLSLNWTLASKNTDGSSIPASGAGSLSATRVEWGTCNGALFGTKIADKLVPMPSTTTTVTGLPPSTVCLRAYSQNSYGVESDATGAVIATILPPKPAPPTGLSVTVLTAFMAVRTQNAYAVLPVGTVPRDTLCDARNGVIAAGSTYYAVPVSSVIWSGTVRPSTVVAQCG